MKHRHSGPKVQYRTRKGKLRLRQRPLHSQMEKYKNLNYKQLRKKFRINPILDDDGDGVRNYKDCRPWDKDKHFLGFGGTKFKELEYVRDGVKETGNVTIAQSDPHYDDKVDEVKEFASKHALSYTVTEKSDGEEMHTSIDVSASPEAKVDWDSEDHIKIGEALGYPEKAIEGFADEDREENAEDVRRRLMDEGISKRDIDRLEFVPYGMSADEVREEIEKRK